MQPHVSIIIPVYNASKTLQTTVASLQAQTLEDWECICVNDGSKDASEETLETLIRGDCRIKGNHQRNGGASAARNRGLAALSGETLFFLDADDTLNPSCLHTLYSAWQTTHANWCSCGRTLYYADGTTELSSPNQNRLILRDEFLEQYNWIETSVVWGKLFDASWFKKANLHFNETLCVAEDSLLMSQAVCRADKIAHLGSCNGYNYFVANSSGLMQSASKKYPLMRMRAFEIILKENNDNDKIIQHHKKFWMRMILSDMLGTLKKREWSALVFPSRFTITSWKIAAHSPKHFLGWSALFILKHLSTRHV